MTFKGGKGLAFATPKPGKAGSENLDEISMEPDSTSMDVTDLRYNEKSDKVCFFYSIIKSFYNKGVSLRWN